MSSVAASHIGSSATNLDPADLFALLYDALASDRPTRLQMDEWRSDPGVDREVRSLERGIIAGFAIS